MGEWGGGVGEWGRWGGGGVGEWGGGGVGGWGPLGVWGGGGVWGEKFKIIRVDLDTAGAGLTLPNTTMTNLKI
jgi:hypothetical protein